ncbi:hypothetical protein Celaphus_00002085 [Cervus elaphus hippelaphus]|uniref:G-protein coupled receptors family 1 profile domain-containing protein n=1 Tax=Cervus elaphus hippelaphus TaxID=46360 RepID=A0A212CFR9_CEREH|nr:hypothetical protein Celaphus_00002085 [Cervus elaphus hippelaphus]
MSAGNVTPWGSSAAGEEVWVASGVEVEGAELPTFSVATKVRVGVTVVLFVSSAGGNLAVLWSVTRPQPNQLRPSPVRRLFAHLDVADLLVTFVVMPLDATWNITVQWLARDIACRTLMFLKLMPMYPAAFLPVGHWARPPGSCTPPVWTALSWKETSWGSLGTQLPACLAPGEFALRRSSDSRSRARHWALRLALLVLLTFIFCWPPYYLLGLWYWFSPTMLTEVPPSLSHILFLFGLLNAPLDPFLYGAFTFSCRRGHQEHSINSSREGGSGRVP